MSAPLQDESALREVIPRAQLSDELKSRVQNDIAALAKEAAF